MDVVTTKDGFRVTHEGKHYLITHAQLANKSGEMGVIGASLLPIALLFSKSNPKEAYLYHNAEEAGVLWDEVEENKPRSAMSCRVGSSKLKRK